MKTSYVHTFFCGAALLASFVMTSCSEEKKDPFPDLPAIELPKDVPALYSGSLPCDDCVAKMVRMTLKEDMSVEAIQTVVKASSVVDTLWGTYVVTDSSIKVSLSEKAIHWNFKRIKSGNLRYLTSAGTVYEDANGMTADFLKIYKVKVPAFKTEKDFTKE